ncbi:MAG: FAD-dependent oxidoreductase [Stagnimonas sp.]|nr:FAD-dependent oxidoreductase [Stagnimonas sp.]
MSWSLYSRLDQRFGTKTPAIRRQRDLQNRIAGFEARFETDIAFLGKPLKSDCKVVVVGAGFAGLMAGYSLSGSCNVTVLEARDRVGGRVWTQINSSANRAIEAGAELIGYNHPTWLMLAKQFDLGLTVLTSEDAFASMDLEMPLYLDGRLVSSNEAGQIYEEMEETLSRICTAAGELVDPYKPWEARDANELDTKSLSQWILEQHCSSLTNKALEVQFANNNGAPTSRQSYLANLAAIRGGALDGKPDDYFTQSETVKCQQGNQALAEKLAAEIVRAGGSVSLSKPVSRVEIVADRVSIKLANGDIVEADYVVVAIPPSLWPSSAQSEIAFDPPIPPEFQMSMGVAVKYLSEMKSRFWFGAGLSPNSVSDSIGITWDGTDNQMQLEGQTVELSLFAGGNAAQLAIEMFNRSGPEHLRAYYTGEIEKLYRGYSRNATSAPRFVCWPQDRWARGGFSCPAPGEVTRIGPFLNRPFHDRMFFAGEHCCPPFFGYMEGALQSGLAVAKAISQRVGLT